MEKRPSRSSTPRLVKSMPHEFVCVSCNSDVISYGDDDKRVRCYNCSFIQRVAESPEQEAKLRKLLGCEWEERDGVR